MRTPKRQRTGLDLAPLLDALPVARREEARRLAEVFAEATGERPGR